MIRPTDTPPIVAVPPTAPIDTLAELSKQHSVLLQRQSAGPGTLQPTLGELLGFVKAASVLGRTLNVVEQRKTAQAIMDYWVATLLSEVPELPEIEGLRPFILQPFDERADSLVADDTHKNRTQGIAAGENADRVFCAAGNRAKSKGEGALLRRMLLRFLRLKENSAEVYTVPLPADDDIFGEPTANGLLAKLVEADVVRRQDPGNPDNQAFVLIQDSLITTWGFLREIALQRRAFRQVARGWDNGGRNSEALLHGGDQLKQAQDYQDLDPIERAFLNASRLETDRTRVRVIGVISSLLVLAIIVAVFLYRKNTDLEKQRKRLTTDIGHLETRQTILKGQNTRLTETQKGLKTTNLDLKQKNEALETENKNLAKAQEVLKAENNALKADNEALQKNIKQLGDKNDDLQKTTERLGRTTTDLRQSLAIEQTSQSRFGSLSDLLSYSPSSLSPSDLTKLLKKIVGETTKDKKPKQIKKGVTMFEVFVPIATPDASNKVLPYLQALQQIGFVMPAGCPLPRKSVAATSEVRYFYKEDKKLADHACSVLKNSHFPDKRIKSKREYDATAPRGFLQISVAKDAFLTP